MKAKMTSIGIDCITVRKRIEALHKQPYTVTTLNEIKALAEIYQECVFNETK